MKLGISCLAWDDYIDLGYLKQNNIGYIEMVFPKFIEWDDKNFYKLNKFIDKIKKYNIEILSTQSIFFNSGVDNFHSKNFIEHIRKVVDICDKIKVSKLVLGAPSLRTSKINFGLLNNFYYIDNLLRKYNQILLLEPNSKIYNGNYFYTVDEIVNFISHNNFLNIKTMIDTHNIILEKQDPSDIFIKNSPYIDHIHVSEQNLGDFKESPEHNRLSKVLKDNKYDGLIVYESKPSLNLLKSIELFNKTYNL
jgi:sugar phosphate isomerase/epimerase